jgi:hypothetical protein
MRAARLKSHSPSSGELPVSSTFCPKHTCGQEAAVSVRDEAAGQSQRRSDER